MLGLWASSSLTGYDTVLFQFSECKRCLNYGSTLQFSKSVRSSLPGGQVVTAIVPRAGLHIHIHTYTVLNSLQGEKESKAPGLNDIPQLQHNSGAAGRYLVFRSLWFYSR